MRADNSRHVIAAARRRAEQTRQRAVTALRRMDATGQRITFNAVSRATGVSRSWLYTQLDLRAEIQRLRQRHPATPPPQVPPQRQRASDPSLLRRLEGATARIRQLETDNQQLRDAPARALGERRAIEVLGPTNGGDTPEKKLAGTSGRAEQQLTPSPQGHARIASSQFKAMIESRAQDNRGNLRGELRLGAGRQPRRRPGRLVPPGRPARLRRLQGRQARTRCATGC